MKYEKFLQDVKIAPSRFYRNPIDVIRDRRLDNATRLEVLAAWESETRAEIVETSEPGSEEKLQELHRVRDQLKGAA